MALLVKNLPANAGDITDTGSIPGSARSSGGGCGDPLRYSWWEDPPDRGGGWVTVHGVAESDATETAEHSRTPRSLHVKAAYALVPAVQKGLVERSSVLI